MATAIGTQLVTPWGERRTVIAAEFAHEFIARHTATQPFDPSLPPHKSTAKLCIERGGDGAGSQGRRAGHRRG